MDQPRDVGRTGSPRCAARYAHLWSCSLDAAAREFGVRVVAVCLEWFQLYPGVPTDPAKRGGL